MSNCFLIVSFRRRDNDDILTMQLASFLSATMLSLATLASTTNVAPKLLFKELLPAKIRSQIIHVYTTNKKHSFFRTITCEDISSSLLFSLRSSHQLHEVQYFRILFFYMNNQSMCPILHHGINKSMVNTYESLSVQVFLY